MYHAFSEENREQALAAEPLREVIDKLVREMKNRHIDRLQTGECSGEMGVVLNDILTYCGRAADLSSNICVSVVQIQSSSLEVHSFMDRLRAGEEPEFVHEYEKFEEEYRLAPYTPLKVKKKKKKDKKKEKDKKK